MKRVITAATIIGLLAVILTGTGATASRDDDNGRSNREESDGKTIRVRAENTSFHLVDAPPAATGESDLSPGDVFVFTSALTSSGRQVGTDQGTCTLVAGLSAQCAVTLFLRDDTIIVGGAFDLSEQRPSVLAITGGTGEFRDVDGTIEVTHVSSDPVDTDDYVLRIDS
jgi:hypothetical protein